MKLALGSDHTGVRQRKEVAQLLKNRGLDCDEFGPEEGDSSDYPQVAYEVAQRVSGGSADLGILICGTGIGMSIAANKVHGIRAAAVHDTYTAQMARMHNHANILCMGSRTTNDDEMLRIVETFLDTAPEGGRHERRVRRIMQIEEKNRLNGKQAT